MSSITTTQETTPNITSSPPSSLLSDLRRDGFVVIPNLLDPASPLFSTLLSASRDLTRAALRSEWPHIRTLPKQFPPWQSTPENGIWGVQHLLHPSLPLTPEHKLAFQQCYFSKRLLNIIKQLLEIPSSPIAASNEDLDPSEGLTMELFNLLFDPQLPPPPQLPGNSTDSETSSRDFALRWHRDDVPPSLTGLEEEAALGLHPGSTQKESYSHAQYNLPLTPDNSLIVVPGSHARARTEEETRLLEQDAYCKKLPGQVVVKLQPGDAVFYDNNILHRGVYEGGVERLTLHGSVGRSGKGRDRARNVLQHGVGEWVGDVDFGGLEKGLRRRAEGMRKGLVEMGNVAQQKDQNFSQVD